MTLEGKQLYQARRNARNAASGTNRMNVKMILATNIMLFVGMLTFEMFSFASSRSALMHVLGIATWANCLSWAFVAVDFAGIAKLFTDGAEAQEDFAWYLVGAWVLSALFDTSLTYYEFATSMIASANNIMVTSGTVSYHTYTVIMPLIGAVFVFAAQTILVIGLNKLITRIIAQRGG